MNIKAFRQRASNVVNNSNSGMAQGRNVTDFLSLTHDQDQFRDGMDEGDQNEGGLYANRIKNNIYRIKADTRSKAMKSVVSLGGDHRKLEP